MKKIAIIGGGLAGLSAGVFAQKYGFSSTIYEQHTITGGECIGWNRQGFHIDNCIHWLTGTKTNTKMYKLWCELGALGSDVSLFCPECHGVYEVNGQKVNLYNDMEKLREELLRIAPEDKDTIESLLNDVEVAEKMDVPADKPIDMYSLKEIMELGKQMQDVGMVFKKYGGLTCKEYAESFKNPLLKSAFSMIMPDYYSAYALVFTLATVISGNGSIPAGGSLKMSQRMRKRYEDLGGKVVTGAKVEEILIQKNRATGIRLENGTIVDADYVIAAGDVKYTFETLLKNRYHDKIFDKLFRNINQNPVPTSAHVAFAVDADLKEYPTSFIFETEKFKVAETENDYLGIYNYAYEPSFAPEGKTVINVHISQWDKDFYWWEKKYQNKAEYENEKGKMEKEVQERIEKRFPELAGKLTVIDSYTPMTYKRYCNAYHGAWMSFILPPKSKNIMHKGKIKGLGNCFLAGMWLQPPGGTPVAAVTGKYAVQRICKLEGVKF